MTVASAKKSPGQKGKTTKGPSTPNLKARKSLNGTSKVNTPKGGSSPPKNGSPKVTPVKVSKITPVKVAKTPKDTPVKVVKTPKDTPVKVAKTPKDTPVKVAKTPKDTPVKVAKTPKDTPVKVAKTPKDTPVKVAKTPKDTPVKAVKTLKSPKPAPSKQQQALKSPVKRSASAAGLAKQGGVKKSPKLERSRSRKFREVPRCFKNVSTWEAERASNAIKTIKVSNLPDMDEKALTSSLLNLLKKKGPVLQHQLETYKQSGKQFLQVIFKTREAALAAKELNGTLFGDKRIVVLSPDDSYMHVDNKVLVENLPEGATDEDVMSTLISCGKVYSIHPIRAQTYIVTFETNKGKQQALSKTLKSNGKALKVTDYVEDRWRTIFITNLKKNVVKDNVQQFVKNVGPTELIQVHEGAAKVVFKNRQDLAKVLPLCGQTLKGQEVDLLVHGVTFLELGSTSELKNKVKTEIKDQDSEEDSDVEDEEEEDDDDDEDDEEGEEEEDDDEGEEEEEEDDSDDEEEEDDDDDDE